MKTIPILPTDCPLERETKENLNKLMEAIRWLRENGVTVKIIPTQNGYKAEFKECNS